MDAATIIVDLLALAAIAAGALMVFAQPRLRAWWAALIGNPADPERRQLGAGEDPVRYVLTIFGMMLLVFGIIILGFIAHPPALRRLRTYVGYRCRSYATSVRPNHGRTL